MPLASPLPLAPPPQLDWKHAFLSGFNIFAFQVGVVADLIIANLAAARRRVQQLGVSSPAPMQDVGLLQPEDFQSHMGRGERRPALAASAPMRQRARTTP